MSLDLAQVSSRDHASARTAGSSASAASSAEAGAGAIAGEAGIERAPVAEDRLDDLGDIIRAYNAVTENLQKSHEHLRSEVARLQQQLASTDAQLQRSRRLAALGEMAAGIAHEIRNPLGGIRLYIGILEEDLAQLVAGDRPRSEGKASTVAGDPLTLPERCLDTAHRIAGAVRGLDGIVSDVLTFAREIRPRIAPTSMPALLQRIVEEHQPACEQAGVTIQVRCAADVPDAPMDARLMQQAIGNLVRNAIDAMADAPLRVLTLEAGVEGRQLRLAVRDTGPGVDDQTIDRIFNPFFTTRSTGTGLGLAIVHRIIDAHAGAISVHNAVAGGAVFELSMPTQGPPVSAAAEAVASGVARLSA